VAYVDVKAAFNSVDWSAIWKALQDCGMPPFLLHLIRDLHSGVNARVMQSGLSDRLAQALESVRDVNLIRHSFAAIDCIMQQCSDKFGVDVGKRRFTNADCADNGVLFASTPDNWSDIMCSYETTAS